MLALAHERYGPPAEALRLREADAPVPGEGEVLLRVRAASANPLDWHLVRGEPALVRLIAGLRGPKEWQTGADAAGVVEAVGAGVTTLAPGDEVFGTAEGSFAELARAKVDRLAAKPAGVSFEQAAALPVAGCTALQALRDHGELASGQRVLIIGAAGGVGSLAVQIARAMGGAMPRLLLVGCEPERIDDGMGLSEPVAHAVDGAVAMVRELLIRRAPPGSRPARR